MHSFFPTNDPTSQLPDLPATNTLQLRTTNSFQKIPRIVGSQTPILQKILQKIPSNQYSEYSPRYTVTTAVSCNGPMWVMRRYLETSLSKQLRLTHDREYRFKKHPVTYWFFHQDRPPLTPLHPWREQRNIPSLRPEDITAPNASPQMASEPQAHK